MNNKEPDLGNHSNVRDIGWYGDAPALTKSVMTAQQTTWQEYTGSDEQIAEIKSTKNGYVLRKTDGKEIVFVSIEYRPNLENVTHYWTIPDDPLREMKIRQAQTGQPVWVYMWFDMGIGELEKIEYRLIEVTTNPNWNIPNAEYSFSPFED